MNYIREINAFYDWLEINELSKSAVLLWHALMHLNNKSGWQDSFTVARSVIEAKTALKKDAYYTARNQLKQVGLIEFKERGTRATSFKMYSLSSVLQTNFQNNECHLSEKQTTTQTITQTTNQTMNPTTTQTIIKHKQKQKQNKTKEDNKVRESNPFQFFEEEGFGTLSATIGEALGDLIDEFGETRVIAAMKESVIYGARNLAYVTKILKNPNSTKPKGATTYGKSGGTPQKSNDDSGVDW